MTTPRTIRPHKGGRTARAPEARIRPQTLERIRREMQERGASFADLLEENYGGTEMFVKYASKKFIASPQSITTAGRYTSGIVHGATVRLDNKKSQEAIVKAGDSHRSLIDFGFSTDWYPNDRLWVKIS